MVLGVYEEKKVTVQAWKIIGKYRVLFTINKGKLFIFISAYMYKVQVYPTKPQYFTAWSGIPQQALSMTS